MNWDLPDIQRLANTGKIRGYKVVGSKSVNNASIKLPGVKGKGLQQVALKHFAGILAARNMPYEFEYRFLKTRKFRFDIAVPSYKLAIEYDGMVGKGQIGGHQTKAGIAHNCTKFNLAAVNGWIVLRYTARIYKNFESELIEFLMNKK